MELQDVQVEPRQRGISLVKRAGSRSGRDFDAPALGNVGDQEVEFKPKEFATFFLYEALSVLSIPIILLREGSTLAYNMWFLPLWNPLALIQLVMISCVVTINILYWQNYATTRIHMLEIVAVDLTVLLRAAVVATKYSFFNRQLLLRLRTDRMENTARTSLLLGGGWRPLPPETVELEFERACKRRFLGLNKATMMPECSGPIAADCLASAITHDSMRAKHPTPDDPSFSASMLGKQIIYDSRVAVPAGSPVRIYLFGSMHGFLPLIVRLIESAVHKSPVFVSPVDWVISFLFIFTSVYFFSSNVLYMGTAVLDRRRRRYWLKAMGSVFQQGYTPEGASSNTRLRLDLVNHPQNVGLWLLVREALGDFGKGFLRRIASYIGVFCIYLMMMLIYLFYVLIDGFLRQGQLAISTVEVCLVLYDLIVLAGLLLAIIKAGSGMSTITLEHCETLTAFKLHLRTLMADPETGAMIKGDLESHIRYSDALVSDVVETLKMNDRQNAFKVLGFEVDQNFLRAVVVAFLTGIAAAARMLLR